MRLTGDLLAGVLGSVWSALIGFAVVPLYLGYLGIEAYGLIGFFASTQALLQLLDMGLSPTINREVARYSATGAIRESAPLLHTLTLVYFATAAVIAVAAYLLAPYVADHWLNSKTLSRRAVEQSVALMGVVVACRWPIGLYQGVLLGGHRMRLTSGVAMVMATLTGIGAIAVLATLSPTVEAFFIWQALMALLYASVMRMLAWRVIGRVANVRFDVNQLKQVWRFTAGMSGVAISGVILMQLDKVVLSRLLPLDAFGRYALAALVATALYMVLTPTFNVIYPRLSALVARGDEHGIATLYRSGTQLLTAILFPLAAGVAVFSREVLVLWTGNAQLSEQTAPIVSLFIIGTALNGAMHFPYALQLAYGRTRLPLIINLLLIVVFLPLLALLTPRFGGVGGAASWAILNAVYLILGTWLTHRSLLQGHGLAWLARGVLLPFAASSILMFAGGNMIHSWALAPGITLLLGTVLGGLAVLCLIAISGELQTGVTRLFAASKPVG